MTYNHKVIAFFTKHNLYNPEMFAYFKEHSTMIDYDFEEYRAFVGCWPNVNKQNIITGLHVNTPYVKDEKTTLITIHELVHAIEFYNKIGKPYKRDKTTETLPLLYEKIYILENNNPDLIAYGKYLDSKITELSSEEYLFGLRVRDELLQKYDYNFRHMQKITKKLAKRK